MEPIVDFTDGVEFADCQLMQDLDSVFMTVDSKSTKETGEELAAEES
jgi:hypothetical protein